MFCKLQRANQTYKQHLAEGCKNEAEKLDKKKKDIEQMNLEKRER